MKAIVEREQQTSNTLYASVRHSSSNAFQLQVEVTLSPGITILFGPSGAGKTTLLDCLAGLSRPNSGRIVAGGQTLFDNEQHVSFPPQKRNCGYLFQTLALFPHMTARQNVEYGLAHLSKAERHDRSEAILRSFRIAELADRKPPHISGGERQRVALARALVTAPRFLLLDEPLTALDAATKSRIVDDLRDWNRSHGIPILYVTHDRSEAFALGERVIVLDAGSVIAEGTPQEVLDSPRRETVAQLAGFENVFDATVTALHEADGTMTCRILPPAPIRSKAALEKFFVESGIGGREHLSQSKAPSAQVSIEVPLARAELGETLRIGVRAGDIMISLERPTGLSARNLLAVEIAGLRREGVTAIVEVLFAEDRAIHATLHLTPRAVESLKLKVGDMVWLVLKTHSCHVMRG
jgi:molybdate transport system ATP-binding protein